MSAYRREFEETKIYVFLIKEDELLEKHNEIWEKVKNSIKKEFNSDPVYSENYLKAKIKGSNKIPKEGSKFTGLSVTLINFVFRAGKNY